MTTQTSPSPSLSLRQAAPFTAPRLGLWELALDLDGLSFSNPFDPDQVEVSARLLGPDGKTRVWNAFFYQAFSRSGPPEILTPEGEGHWRLRFSPDQVGRWSCSLSAKDGQGHQADLEALIFECQASDAEGLVRIAAQDPHYLAYENGRQFIPIGQNLGWGNWDTEDNTYAYDRWLPKLAENGGNYARYWMWSQYHGIEWTDTGLGDYTKRLDQAWRLDYALERARGLGVQVMLMLVSHNCVLVDGPWAEFEKSPYSQTQGGPCERPRDFFRHPEARRYMKRRLRYIVARWGYASNLIWELCNEIDNTNDYIKDPTIPPLVLDWHQDMARYILSLDPSHIITTSFSRFQNGNDVWRLPEISLTQYHHYSGSSSAEGSHAAIIQRHRDLGLKKPYYGGEVGINENGPHCTKVDPQGVQLQKLHWVGLMAGACGSSSAWWWPDYLEPMGLERQFKGIRALVDQVDMLRAGFKPVRPQVESEATAELCLTPFPEWGFAAEAEDFQADAQGQLHPDMDALAGYLYGHGKEASRRKRLSLNVHLPTAGALRLKLWKHHGAPVLSIHDGAKSLWEGPPPTESVLNVDLSAGEHRLSIENSAEGLIEVIDYEIEGCAPALQAYALQGPNCILGWASHRGWRHDRPEPSFVGGALFFKGVSDGTWEGRWQSTEDGRTVQVLSLQAYVGVLRVTCPSINHDIALHLVKKV